MYKGPSFSLGQNGNLTRQHAPDIGVNNMFADDDGNRLINVLHGSGGKTTYAYAAGGLRRFSHENGANPVTFLWDNDDLLDEITSGAITTPFTVLEGEVIAERRDGARRLAACPEPSRRVPDPLGSTAALLDSTQTKVAESEFWPYGETRTSTGIPSPLGYVGTWGYYAAVANLSYVRARNLNRVLGRWMTLREVFWQDGDRVSHRMAPHMGPGRRPRGMSWRAPSASSGTRTATRARSTSASQ